MRLIYQKKLNIYEADNQRLIIYFLKIFLLKN